MKRIALLISCSFIAQAADQTAAAQTGNSKAWLIRGVFALVIIVCGLFWAVKNKFTDYP
jgi:hypothetical protein